jgi:hypothetical protein
MKLIYLLCVALFFACGKKDNNDSTQEVVVQQQQTTGCKPTETSSIVNKRDYPDIKRIIILILENEDMTETYSNPVIQDLLPISSYFPNFRAIYRPSQPNYIALVSGSNFGINTNDNYDISDTSIADLLEDHGKDWATYAEDYPGNCFLGAEVNNSLYTRKHNPFISFTNITQDPIRCAKIKDSSTFFSDWEDGKLPEFSLYIPNNKNNGHDTDITYSANWLKEKFVKNLKDQQLMQDTLFILTFDEGKLSTPINKIFTLFIGPQVKDDYLVPQCYDHFSLLRTIEEIWSLGSLNRNDIQADIIEDVWE